MAVLRDLNTTDAALEFLARLPAGAYVYSHPKYSPVRYTADVARAAIAAGVSPAGGKLCKISLDDVTELRAIHGAEFGLYDGRCRHVARSVQAGATGVIAVPLCTLPVLPERTNVAGVQGVIDAGQLCLDNDTDHTGRVHRLNAELAALVR